MPLVFFVASVFCVLDTDCVFPKCVEDQKGYVYERCLECSCEACHHA
jgi:hypothetical protein